MNPVTATITIRASYADDDTALARLAALDSAEHVPERPLLLAELDGELRVALSLEDGRVIADPFFATSQLITMLQIRAQALMAESPRRGLSGLTRRPRTAALPGPLRRGRRGVGARRARAAWSTAPRSGS